MTEVFVYKRARNKQQETPTTIGINSYPFNYYTSMFYRQTPGLSKE